MNIKIIISFCLLALASLIPLATLAAVPDFNKDLVPVQKGTTDPTVKQTKLTDICPSVNDFKQVRGVRVLDLSIQVLLDMNKYEAAAVSCARETINSYALKNCNETDCNKKIANFSDAELVKYIVEKIGLPAINTCNVARKITLTKAQMDNPTITEINDFNKQKATLKSALKSSCGTQGCKKGIYYCPQKEALNLIVNFFMKNTNYAQAVFTQDITKVAACTQVPANGTCIKNLKQFQTFIGTKSDGLFGKNTITATNKALDKIDLTTLQRVRLPVFCGENSLLPGCRGDQYVAVLKNNVGADFATKFTLENVKNIYLPKIASYLVWTLSGIVVVMIIISAYQIITAGGNYDNVKKHFQSAMMGLGALVLAILAYSIVKIIINIMI